MKLLSHRSDLSWRAFVVLGLGACLSVPTAASVLPASPLDLSSERLVVQEADPLKFTRSGRMMLMYQVAAGNDQDFVLTWKTIKDLLTKTNDPGLAAFGRSLKMLQVETEAGADSVFAFDLDPVSTTYSYHPVTLLFETLAEDPDNPGQGLTYDQANELYEKIREATATTWWLSEVD